MIDWNRWLPGIGQDQPEEDDAVTKTLKALGQVPEALGDPFGYAQGKLRSAGQSVVGAVQGATQAVQDAYAVPTEQRPPQYSGPSGVYPERGTSRWAQPRVDEPPPPSLPSLSDVGTGLSQAGSGLADTASSIGHTIATEGIATPIGRGLSNAAFGAAGVTPKEPETPRAPLPFDQAVTQTIGSFGSNIGAVQQGVEQGGAAGYGQAALGALGAVGDLAPSTTMARQLNEMLPKADVRPYDIESGQWGESLGEVGVGDVIVTAALLKDALTLGYTGLRAGSRAAPGVLQAIREGVPAERFHAWWTGNAQRVAAAGTVDDGVQMLGSGVVPDAAESRRMYHGTAEAFGRPDPAKFDRKGLYGPGYYLTDDPTIASSYATARNVTPGGITPKPILRANRLADEIKSAEYQLSRNPSAEDRAWLESRIVDARAEMDRVTSQGPNVRAVDVPEGLTLLDTRQSPEIARLRAISEAIPDPAARQHFDSRAFYSDEATSTPLRTNDEVYGALEHALDSKVEANDALRRAGYDGIAHEGGLNRALLDANGEPIRHDVTVVFPDALDKIRNAFSGEAGGSGVIPSAARGLRADAFNAAQGGVMGAASEDLQAQQEGREADPAERARRALIGGGLAVAGGRYARPGAGRQLGAGVVPGPPGQAGRAAQHANPHIRNTARQMQGQYAPSGVDRRPLAERVVAALTDKHAIVGNVEQEIQGRVQSAGGQAPQTRLAERVRENPNSIAAQRAREELAPAFQAVGEDADWMEQVLVHAHNVDIAAQKGQEAYDAAIAAGRSPQRAQAIADRVRQTRAFSGGMNEQDLHDALADIQATLGPARWQQVLQSAQAVWDTGRKSLDEKLAEGMISPALHQELTTRYPHYVRTDIADYFEAGPAAPSPGGKTMGVSSVGIKPISAVGTTKDRVNPVLSSIDALYGHEAAVTRNAAAKDLAELRDADPQARGLFKEVAPDVGAYRGNRTEMVPPDYSLRNGEQKLTAWEHGEARQFIIPAEYAALLSPRQGALLGDSALASGTRSFFGLWKSLITTHNPAFQLVVSPVRDLGDYAVGEATRSASKGGARGMVQAAAALPGVVGDYLKALPAAFEGLGKGQFSQEVGDLRTAGAGFEGRPARTDAGLREAYRDLADSGGMALRSPADMLKATRTILTLGAEPIGSRLELVPRIAAARRAAGRGADELGQAMAFKDATIDFLRGGWLTQQLNVVVPFINPTVQSSAQVARLAKRNPAAAAAAVGTAIGVPAMLAEAWNRSDDQRAAAYADVPDSVKNTGIVWMLPDAVAGSTELGEGKPNYLWVPLGSFAFAARLAREGLGLADPVTGLVPRPERPGREVNGPFDAAARAAEVGGEILAMFSPVKGADIGSSVASLIPPVAAEAMEVKFDTDFYRGNRVATGRRDEQASRLSQGVAAGLNALGGTDQVRPSQVEHVVRGVGGYAGQLATAASDLGRDRGVSRPIQDIPVVGGLASRVVRDTGGQRLEDETSIPARAPAAVRSTLAEAGMRSDQIDPVSNRYKGAPLTHAEEERWQRMTNALVTREVLALRRTSEWRERGADKQKLVAGAITSAKEQAAQRALPRLDEGEIERRKTREERRKAG